MILRVSRKTNCRKFRTFVLQKTYQKPLQNDARTTKKSRCKTHCFQHRFFRVLASILEAFGPPTWSQIGSFGPQKLYDQPFGDILSSVLVQNGVLEGSRLAFRGSRARFSRVWGRFFRDFRMFWGTWSRSSLSRNPSSNSSRNPCQ